MEVEVTDRYQALGIPYPDPKTVCKGQCEGTGVVPVYSEEGVFGNQLKSAKGCHVVEKMKKIGNFILCGLRRRQKNRLRMAGISSNALIVTGQGKKNNPFKSPV